MRIPIHAIQRTYTHVCTYYVALPLHKMLRSQFKQNESFVLNAIKNGIQLQIPIV